MIKVKQTVEIYEENGKEIPIGTNKSIRVESHWNRDESVILVFGRKHITVIGQDLITAINNAMNTNRF